MRNAIGKLKPLPPDLAAHLQRTIVTAIYCRYRGDHSITWNGDNPGDRPTAATP